MRLINKNTQQQVASAENITRHLSELHRGIRDGALMGGVRGVTLMGGVREGDTECDRSML